MEKLTKDDILKIKKGQTRSFALGSGLAIHSARSLVNYTKRTTQPLPYGITNYKTSSNVSDGIFTITAL